jgi:hypothetical protein
MTWDLSDDEMQRVLSWDTDDRYAYAINKIREHGELWTLKSPTGWVVSSNPTGQPCVPIWPHEHFARLEATGSWADAQPDRIPLDKDWFTAARASWFETHDVRVTVFLAGTSSMSVDYSLLCELLRSERRARYVRNNPSSGTAREPKRDTRETNDLVSYVNMREIELVVERVPAEYRTRIRDLFRRRSSDARVLGSVTTHGRRDIELSTVLPIRVSLRRYLHGGQSAEEFGAPKLGQWPPWAVRRFLLYDVLFHEIGHLQVVDKKAARVQRKFASETRAQEFADEMRRVLYSRTFDHPDPIHNAPSEAELATTEVWNRLDKAQRAQMVRDVLTPRRMENADMALLEPLTTEQRAFLSKMFGVRARRHV